MLYPGESGTVFSKAHVGDRNRAGVPPSPVISREAVQSPYLKTWMQRDTPSRLFGHARPSQDMSLRCEIWTFLSNDQVRVVTRSLSRLKVVRGPLASPRLSQDRGIIAKTVAFVRDGFRPHAPNGALPCEGILNVKLVLGEFVSCMSPCLMMSIPISISHTIRSPVETRNPATRTRQGKMASRR